MIRPKNARDFIQDNDTINTFSPTDTQDLINIAKDVGSNTRSLTDVLKMITARINQGDGFAGELLHDGPLSREGKRSGIKGKVHQPPSILSSFNFDESGAFAFMIFSFLL